MMQICMFASRNSGFMVKQAEKNDLMERFVASLKRNNMRATPQRLAVHRAMLDMGHACADMVAESLAADSEANVTVASVYNILTQLANAGIYARRLSANNKMYFDVHPSRHIHLYDSVNHVYKDVPDDELLNIVGNYFSGRRFRGYNIEDIDIQIVVRPTRRKYKL